MSFQPKKKYKSHFNQEKPFEFHTILIYFIVIVRAMKHSHSFTPKKKNLHFIL